MIPPLLLKRGGCFVLKHRLSNLLYPLSNLFIATKLSCRHKQKINNITNKNSQITMKHFFILSLIFIGGLLNIQAQNNALEFDGIDDYITCPTAMAVSQMNSFTVETWVKWDGGSNGTIYSEADTASLNPILSILAIPASGQLEIVLRDASQVGLAIYPTNGAISITGWTHLAFVRSNATTAYLYIDGLPTDTFTFAAPSPWTVNEITIGTRKRSAFDGFFKGEIDEVRTWSYARSATEIMAYKDCHLTGTETDLVSYYDFNQGIAGANNPMETTLMDRTSNAHNGTLNTFALTTAASNWVDASANGVLGTCIVSPNNALEFDGLSDYVDLGAALLPTGTVQDFSISAWIKTTDDNGAIVTQYSAIGVGGRFGFKTQNGEIAYWRGGSTLVASVGANVNDGIWHHVALTHDSTGNVNLYVDGLLNGTGNDLAILEVSNTVIGNFGTSANVIYEGSIDDLRLWNRVRSATEIMAYKDCHLTGTETGLIAYYDFNQGISGANNYMDTILMDRSPNAHNGVLNTFALTGAVSNWIDASANGISGTCIITSLKATNLEETLNVNTYPNPVSSTLSINFGELSSTIKSGQIEIINLNGQVLYQTTNNLHPSKVIEIKAVEKLAPSMYFLSITLDNGDKVLRKFIKQ